MWLIELLAYILIGRAAWMAAHSLVVLSCKADHGHGKDHTLRCYCPCHRGTKTT